MGLDTVEILMAWEEAFGVAILDEEARALRTPRMACDLISLKVGVVDEPRRACLTLRAFHRLRTGFMQGATIDRRSFHPHTPLKQLVRQKEWNIVRSACGIPSLPKPGWFSMRTVSDLTRWLVIHAAKHLKAPGEPWTRDEVRSIVRAVVIDHTGLEEFEDNDDFIYDIGLN